MKNRTKKTETGQRLGWLAAAMLYLFILAADFGGAPLPADGCKLALVALCALLARGQTRWGAAFTVVCDFLLLFTPYFTAGVCIFCVVQLVYLRDLLEKRAGGAPTKKQSLGALWPGLLFVGILILAPADRLLLAVAGAYGALLLQNAVLGVRVACQSRRRMDVLRAVGFWLFVGCDICVALYNTAWPVWSVGRWMWLFYGPSQALLALSSGSKTVPEPVPGRSHRPRAKKRG